MRHFFVTTGVLALLATPALVLPQAAGAAPAEVQQAKAVQYGVYKNASGQTIEVVTLTDGGVMAVVDGSSVLTGQKALDFLLANGIDLTIMGGGHIMGQTLTKGATVVTAARKATPADAEKLSQATQGAVNVVAKQAVRPPSVLPENVAVGSGAQSMQARQATGNVAPNNFNADRPGNSKDEPVPVSSK